MVTVDWSAFTPWSALAGGALIGLAAAILMTGLGRIAGISGIFAGLLQPRQVDNGWRWAFVAGLMLSPWLLHGLAPERQVFPPVNVTHPLQWLLLLGAGLLAGYGTRMANGCTSGHGVCGLARLSPRSLAAVLVFMGSGMATVAVLRQVAGVAP